MAGTDQEKLEYVLNNTAADAVSAVKFQPGSSQFLASSSWDGTVRIHDVRQSVNAQRVKYSHTAPILDCDFLDATRIASGGLDRQLKLFEINTAQETILGSHDAPIRKVLYNTDANLILTGGWDYRVCGWDPRESGRSGAALTVTQPERVYAMDASEWLVIVATAARHVLVYDVRNMGEPMQKRESPLKYQTRCVRLFSRNLFDAASSAGGDSTPRDAFAVGSIEGRVAIELLSQNPEAQKRKYAFKCHRIKDGATERIYSVNSIAVHSVYNTFATGGSDGLVNIWDGVSKKRLCQFHPYPTGVQSLAFSADGSAIAIACSYMNEDQEAEKRPGWTQPEDQIFVRIVQDHETRPKTSAN